MDVAKFYRRARDRGAPIVALDCTDQSSAEQTVSHWEASRGAPGIVYAWDALRGARCIAPEGGAPLAPPKAMLLDVIEAWREPNSVMLVHGWDSVLAASWLHGQAVANGRDAWKSNGRMIVLCGPHPTLPETVAQHSIRMAIDMPTADDIDTIVTKMVADYRMQGHDMSDPDGVVKLRIADANMGLDAFACEQNIALALNGNGFDVPAMWRTKEAQINELPGVTLHHKGVGFSQVSGYVALKDDASDLFNGPQSPGVIFWLDEADKSFTGLGHDTSGVTDQIMQSLLTEWAEQNWDGMQLLGPRGTGKSEMAKAIGMEFDVPVLQASFPEMQGSLVGQTNANVRRVFNALRGMGGGRVMVIATGNTDNLPSALQRRFKSGKWYFDLPAAEQREGIWIIHHKAQELPGPLEIPDDDGWTGSDIASCCYIAKSRGISLESSARRIIPYTVSAPLELEQSRQAAVGKVLDATTGVPYTIPVCHGQPVRYISGKG